MDKSVDNVEKWNTPCIWKKKGAQGKIRPRFLRVSGERVQNRTHGDEKRRKGAVEKTVENGGHKKFKLL